MQQETRTLRPPAGLSERGDVGSDPAIIHPRFGAWYKMGNGPDIPLMCEELAIPFARGPRGSGLICQLFPYRKARYGPKL